MPLTVPAHQALVLPLKIRWPDRFDGIALCVGSAAPDLAYSLGPWLNGHSHDVVGWAVWSTPITVLFAVLLRRRALGPILAQIPDGGPFRFRSYRVLAERRPGLFLTAVSAAVGAGSHILIDGFTHAERFAARFLGLDGVLLASGLRGPMTGAKLLQYVSHGLGTVVAVLLALFIGRAGLLERWYGPDLVAEARVIDVSMTDRVVFWTVALAPPVLVAARTAPLTPSVVFPMGTTLAFSLLAAGLLPTSIRRSARDLASVAQSS